MLKYTIAFTLFCLSFFSAANLYAQDEESLKSEIKTLALESDNDTAYASACVRLGGLLTYNKPSEAASWLLRAAYIYGKLSMPNEEAEAYKKAGLAYDQSQMSGMALDSYLKESKIWENNGNMNGVAGSFLDIGMVYYHQGMYSLALNVFRKAEKLFQSLNDKAGLVKCYNNIGIAYRESAKPDSAILLFKKALDASATITDRSGSAETIYHIGYFLMNHNQPDSAKEYFYQALSLLALKGYKTSEDLILQGRAIQRLGTLAQRRQDYATAESFFYEGIRITSEPAFTLQNVQARQRLGNFYSDIGKFDQAIAVYAGILRVETAYGFLRELKTTHVSLAKLYAKKGDIQNEAKELRIIAVVSDSLLKIDTKHRLSDMETMLNTIGTENELAQLREKNKTGKIIIFAILGFVIMGGLFVFYRMRILRRTNEFFHDITAALFDGIAIATNNTIVGSNENLAALSGLPRNELTGKKFDDFINAHLFKADVPISNLTDSLENVLLTFPSQSGKASIIKLSSRPFHYNGQESKIITFRDITDKLESDELAAKATIMLETAIDESPIPMVLVSVETMSYLIVNSAARHFLGLPLDAKYRGINFNSATRTWKTIYPDLAEVPVDELPLVKAMHGKVTQNQILGMKIGDKIKWAIFNATPIFNANQEAIAAFLVYTDITEAREIEERLRNSETRYRMLADNASDVIWTADLEGKFTYISQAVVRLSGFTPDEVIGKSIFSRIARESAPKVVEIWARTFEEYTQTGQLTRFSGELEQYCKNGSTIWVQINVDGLFDENKKLVGIIGVTRNIQEQRLSRLELAIQKSTLESIVTNMAQGVYIVSPELELLSYNKQFADILEIPVESISRGMSLDALFTPWLEKHQFTDEEIAKFRSTRKANARASFEISFMGRDEKKHWVKTFHNPLPEGGYVRTVNDITGQKEIEEKLYQSEALYRSILAASPDPILILTIEGDISFISPAGCKLFCLEDLSMLDKPFLEFIMEEDRERVMVHLEILMIQGTSGSMECRGMAGDGTIISLEANAEAIINSHGDVNGIALALRDITERKRFEQMLIANEERLTRIMDLMPFPILLTTIRDNCILYLNQSAIDTFRFAEDNIIGNSFTDYFSDPADQDNIIRELDAAGYMRDREILLKRAEGDSFWARLSSLKTELADETVIISGLFDVTTQKEAELSLKKAKEEADQANRAKSEFLANMSHEIRTPMNAVLGFAELLKRRKLDSVAADYLDGIERGGRSLLNLINDILDLSKIEAGKLDIQYYPTDIENVCRDLWKIFEYQAKQKNIEFRSSFSTEKSSILLIDEVRLRQIILNLLGNAIKFTHKGYVSCEVSIKENRNHGGTCALSIVVKDTGIGIQPSERDKIFKAFHQQEGQSARKYGGTGLGLTITRRLTKLMKGNISLDSTPGEGTEFRVTFASLKHGELEAPEIENELTNENVLFKGQKVLMVEDNESNRKVVHGYLEEHNVELYEAKNGEEGCLMAKELIPDLILMDLQMPVMDGYQAIKVIRGDKATKHIPIIIVTASVMQGEKVKVKALAEGYLHKPLLKKKLLSEIMKHLEYSFVEEIKQEAESSQVISAENSAQLSPEIISILKNKYLLLLRELADGMVINEIQDTASEIQNFPGIAPESELCRLSTELFKSAETFDADQIETALQQLTNYISTL